jgi:fructokinase
MSKEHILCLGNIAYDLVQRKGNSEKNFLFAAYPGGSVFNTALLLSKLGCRVAVLSKTGNDFLGDKLIATMKKHGINVRYVFQENCVKTALAVADIDSKGNSSYIFYRPENTSCPLKKEEIPESVFKQAKILHTDSAFTYKDGTYEDTMYTIAKARKHNVFVSYDPNWRNGRIKNTAKARKRIARIIEYTNLLKLSDTDAIGITGAKTLEAAVKKLPSNTIITAGLKGAFHVKDKRETFIPAFQIKVADTIGAGDAFTAGLLHEYARKGEKSLTRDLRQTMLFASAAAALICAKSGATAGIKKLAQVKRLAEKYA